jgi:YVTN family beta-propeller protein
MRSARKAEMFAILRIVGTSLIGRSTMNFSFRKQPLFGLFLLALSTPAVAGATSYTAATNPTRTVGPQPDGSYVVSSNQLITPFGKLVSLGAPVSVKAIAQNPLVPDQAAVLLMDSDYPVAIINTKTGEVLQYFVPVITSGTGPGQTFSNVTNGSFTGIAYSPNGAQLLLSQDAYSATFGGYLTVANVNTTTGLLTPSFSVQLPNPTAVSSQNFVGVPGTPALPDFNAMYNPYAINPAGIAVTPDNGTALVALNANNTVGVVALATQTLTAQIPVGNAPNRVVINPAGTFAYVSNEGGRACGNGAINNPITSTCGADFTDLSDGTGIVADPYDGFATTGTVSVIALTNNGGAVSGSVVATVNVGLHPAGLAISPDGSALYVANSYSDTVSVINTATNTVTKTIAVPPAIAGGAFGAGVNGIVLDPNGTAAYVSLGQSNAVAVISLPRGIVEGYIPTAYFPSAITFDPARRTIVVANDKGIGAQGYIVNDHGVDGYNTHEEQGDVSLLPVARGGVLKNLTQQVIVNNNWNSPWANLNATTNPAATPVPVPTVLGNPSTIKHVFLFIKENRTYDQILGDVQGANGDPSLAIFGYDTPNQHALVSRFPLLDNVYAPSRQSADGHPWIVTGGSFYSNDILSPDWIRSYPGGNSDDALTYTPRGFLWSSAVRANLSVRLYGEYTWFYQILGNSSVNPNSITGSPYYPETNVYSWAQWFAAHECSGYFTQTPNTSAFCTSQATNPIASNTTDNEFAAVPSISTLLDPNYPSFNLNIPDQVRADYFIQELATQTANNSVPNLSVIWLPDDHTNGTGSAYPSPNAYQADNDLALGRMVQAISSSSVWNSTAIFVEEDDSQDGVDHIDGHREPVYIISPYAAQNTSGTGIGPLIHTTYTAANINRTIEQILGFKPLTQFDTVATPMFDAFNNVAGVPTGAAAAPFTAVPATIPLNVNAAGQVIANSSPTAAPIYASNKKISPMEKAWELASEKVMKGNESRADAVDETFLDHAIWYSSTKYARPYPGESKILPPEALMKKVSDHAGRDSDD